MIDRKTDTNKVKSKSAAQDSGSSSVAGGMAVEMIDNRPLSTIQRKLQTLASGGGQATLASPQYGGNVLQRRS